MNPTLTKLATLAALALSTACTTLVRSTPPGFVELDEDQYDYRATSADGVVVAVTELDHDPKGEIGFWTRAIENQMRNRGGYALLERRDVETTDGVRGRQLRFGHDEGKIPHLYYVTVFATSKCLYLVEAGGRRELVQEREAEIDALTASLNAKRKRKKRRIRQ